MFIHILPMVQNNIYIMYGEEKKKSKEHKFFFYDMINYLMGHAHKYNNLEGSNSISPFQSSIDSSPITNNDRAPAVPIVSTTNEDFTTPDQPIGGKRPVLTSSLTTSLDKKRFSVREEETKYM